MQKPVSLAKTSLGGINENLHRSIEPLVLALIINAYKRVRDNKVYPLKEHEVWFSTTLVPYMEELCSEYENITGQPWSVTREHVHDDEQMRKGEKNPNAATRIDVVITTWKLGRQKTKFPFECKRISENDTDLVRLYIEEGLIDRYLNKAKDYAVGQSWGGMIGYILQGSLDTIIDKLNKQVKRQRENISEYLILDKPIENFEAIYKSRHQHLDEADVLTITHIFLPFPSQKTNENA